MKVMHAPYTMGICSLSFNKSMNSIHSLLFSALAEKFRGTPEVNYITEVHVNLHIKATVHYGVTCIFSFLLSFENFFRTVGYSYD